MNLAFNRLFLLCAVLVSALWLSPTHSVRAENKKPATLSFDLNARVTPVENRNQTRSITPQTIAARVHLRGERVRVETKLGSQSIVMLLVRPYVYRLLPSSKAGVRYKGSTPLPELGAFAANWQTLLKEPRNIRAALQQKGARKIGVAKISGVNTDIYAADEWNKEPRRVKIWLRQTDSLPLRLETTARGLKIALSWSRYRRGHALSPALFVVPKNYRIRDGQAPAPVS